MRKQRIFDKRIPTLFAIIILALVIGVSTYLIQSGIFYQGKAAPDNKPENVIISNITDSSFTVSFATAGSVDAVIQIENSTGNTLILDDRDKKSGTKGKYFSHHITSHQLLPGTRYAFKIISQGQVYEDPSYIVVTAKEITTSPPDQKPLFGKVLLPNGDPASDTLVIATIDNSQNITAVTDDKGEFIIPTNSIRNASFDRYTVLQNEQLLSLQFLRQNMAGKATATFEVAQNLPTVILQQQYMFVEKKEEVDSQVSRLTFLSQDETVNTVTIKIPEEGETFTDFRPMFSGTSYPNSNVRILIPEIVDQQILTRPDGLWTFQPQTNLPQGEHSLSITVDELGKRTSLTRNFIIFPQGSQVIEGATLFASPTFTPTMTPTPTNSPTPTLPIQTTPTTFFTPTPTPLPTIYFTPTPQPSIQPPGDSNNAFLLTGLSVILIIAGLTILFAL